MGIVQREAFWSTLFSYLGVIVGYFNKVVLFILLLSAEEIGLMNLLLSVAVLFSKMANLGTLNSTWRFFPIVKNDENKHYGFFSYQMLTVLLGGLIFTLLLLFFQSPIKSYYSDKSPYFVDYYYWVIPLGFFLLVYGLFDSFLRAQLKTLLSTFVNDVLLRLVTTLLLVFYWLEWYDFDLLVLLYVLSYTLPIVVLYFYLKHLNVWSLSYSSITIRSKLKRVIRNYSAFSYLNSFSASIAFSLDTIMIAGMVGLKSVGVYSIIFYITRPLVIPYASLLRIGAPLVPRYIKERKFDQLNAFYKELSSVSLIIGLFLFLGVWCSRNELIELLPSYFSDGIYIFLFLMLGKLVDMYASINAIILISSRYYRMDLLFTAVLIVLVFFMNLLLIESYGATGAAISTGIGIAFYSILRAAFVWYKMKLSPLKMSNLLVVAIAVLTTIALEYMPVFTDITLVNIALRSIVLVILFPVPVLYFRLEPALNDYLSKMASKLARKTA